MTDTAREAAIERVRAYVEACDYDDREIVNTAEDCDLTAGDLRLLLQPSEAPVTAEEGWIEWTGGDCPAPGRYVDVKCRDGSVFLASGGNIPVGGWKHRRNGWDIIAYRLVTPAPPTGEGEPQGEES